MNRIEKYFSLLILMGIFFSNNIYGWDLYVNGDSYSALYPCNTCPMESSGGVQDLFSTYNKISKKDSLRFFCGNLSGGSIYDTFSVSEKENKIRSIYYAQAMTLMGYDLFFPGESDFLYGFSHFQKIQETLKNPWLISNLVFSEKSLSVPVKEYHISGQKIGVCGLISPSFVPSQWKNVQKLGLSDTIEKWGNYFRDTVDVRILITSLTEKELENLLPVIDKQGFQLIIFSGPRTITKKFEKRTLNSIVRTEFQSRRLGKIRFTKETMDFQEIFLLNNETHPKITEILEGFSITQKKMDLQVLIKLYRMPQCPYSLEPQKLLRGLQKDFSFIEVQLENIYEKKDGEPVFIHGEGEKILAYAEECVKRYYPQKYWDFIESEELWMEGENPFQRIRDINLERLNLCLESSEAKHLFFANNQTAEKFGISESPTIYINNKRYKGPMTREQICSAIAQQAISSGHVPPTGWLKEGCYSDNECISPGKIGVCREGKCVFLDPVPYRGFVVRDRKSLLKMEKRVLDSILSLHPGGKIEFVEWNSEKGKEFIDKYEISKLPCFLFNSEILETHRFPLVRNAFQLKKDLYILKPSHYRPNILVKPSLKKNFLFVSPLKKDHLAILQKGFKDNSIGFLLFRDEKNKLQGKYGVSEVEEARRILAVSHHWPEKLFDYLEYKKSRPLSSYWEEPLKLAGLNPEEVKAFSREPEIEAEIQKSLDLLENFDATNQVQWIYEGRECMELTSETHYINLKNSVSLPFPPPLTPEYKNAWKYLLYQCDLGARVPGSVSHEKVRTWMIEKLRNWGYGVQVQTFQAERGSAKNRTFHNIIASKGMGLSDYYLVGAHYDCRPFCERDSDPEKVMNPLPGANDGASGTSVLLNLAEIWKDRTPLLPVKFIFFDGEDWGMGRENMFYGSEYHSRSIHQSGEYKKVKGMILLDMIGDKDLCIGMEGSSLITGKKLIHKIMDAAEKINATHFHRIRKPAVMDDHVFYSRLGIPAVDLIDFEYPWWHTTEDTVDKVCSESLEEVTRVMDAFFQSLSEEK